MCLLPVRGTDNYGSGAYLASRGNRQHKGIDLACYPNTRISLLLIGIDSVGKVTKIGMPYEDNPRTEYKESLYKYVQVTTPSNIDIRIFYITPILEVGQFITADDVLGISQNLQPVYPGITHHIHIEVKSGNGNYLDPKKYINSWCSKDRELITV